MEICYENYNRFEFITHLYGIQSIVVHMVFNEYLFDIQSIYL